MSCSKKNGIYFSVVIPLYNKGPHIERCISSVLNQTYKDFELVVVDDGSTDDGLSRLEKYSDPRICLYRKRNGGAASARNHGIRKAKGEYIAFLDADDEWDEKHLETISLLNAAVPNAVYLGTAYQRVSNGVVIRTIQLDNDEKFRVIDDYIDAFSKTMPLSHSSSTVIKKDVLLSIGGFPTEPRYFEDWNVWLKAAMLGTVAYSSKITATLHTDAVNRSANDYTAEKRLFSLKHLVASLEEFSTNKNVATVNYGIIIAKMLEDFLKGCILSKQLRLIDNCKNDEIFKYLGIKQRLLYLSRLNRILRKGYFLKNKISK